jgi:hypothetical protein
MFDVIKLACLFHIAVEPGDLQIKKYATALRLIKDERMLGYGWAEMSPHRILSDKCNTSLKERGAALFPACRCNLQAGTGGGRGVCIGQSMACFGDVHLAAS